MNFRAAVGAISKADRTNSKNSGKRHDLARVEEHVDAIDELLKKCRDGLHDATQDMQSLHKENLSLRQENRRLSAGDDPTGPKKKSWLGKMQPSSPKSHVQIIEELDDSNAPDRVSRYVNSASTDELEDAEPSNSTETQMFHLSRFWEQERGSLQYAQNIYSGLHNGHASRDRVSVWGDEDRNTVLTEALDDAPELETKTGQRMCSYPLRPDSGTRICWDVTSMILVLYDVIVLPLNFLDLPENNSFLISMEWITRIFWTLDILVSFCSGYIQINGDMVLRPKLIVLHYFKTWFALDFFVVTIDWLETFVGSSAPVASDGSGTRLIRGSRGFRALRMVRLLRVLRVRNLVLLSGILELNSVNSEKLQLGVSVLKIVLGLLMMAHFIGCLWYGLGEATADAYSRSWTLTNSLQEAGLAEKYIASVHWSCAQLVGGMDEFVPSHPLERLYAVFVLIFTFMVTIVVLSNLTTSMTKLFLLSQEHEEGMRTLRTYLSQNRISSGLANRIVLSVKHSLNSKVRIDHFQVSLLQNVSTLLQSELYLVIYGRSLNHHVFFGRYTELCPQVMRRVCTLAISTATVVKGDIIFEEGEQPEHPAMYILADGSTVYLSYSGQTAKLRNEGFVFNMGHYISEAALWTTWVHMGTLKASDPQVCMLILDAYKFQQLAMDFLHTDMDPKVYANNFVKMLNLRVAEKEVITDIFMDLPATMLSENFSSGDVMKHKALIHVSRAAMPELDVVPRHSTS